MTNLEQALALQAQWFSLCAKGKRGEAAVVDKQRAEIYGKLTDEEKDQFWESMEDL